MEERRVHPSEFRVIRRRISDFEGIHRGKPANSGDVAQRLYSLLKLEMPQILLNDIRHCHSQRRCKILRRHIALFVFIAQET